MACATRFNLDLFLASAVPVLDPASKDAAATGLPFVVLVLICLAILIVVGLICTSIFRSRASGDQMPQQESGGRRSKIVVAGPFFNGANPNQSTVYFTLDLTHKAPGKRIAVEELGMDPSKDDTSSANGSSTTASTGPPRPGEELRCSP